MSLERNRLEKLVAARDLDGICRWVDEVVSRVRFENASEHTMAILAECLDALLWTSGANDFQVGGLAFDGWEKLCRPLIGRLREFVRPAPSLGRHDLTALSVLMPNLERLLRAEPPHHAEETRAAARDEFVWLFREYRRLAEERRKPSPE